MQDDTAIVNPQHLAAIMRDTAALGFAMASEPLTGALLRTLAASRPHHVSPGDVFLTSLAGKETFDLIFADTWPGKYDHLEDALALLKRGGLYVIDDMLPQPNWPDGHAANVAALIQQLESRPDLVPAKLRWATGIIIAAKR